MPVPRSPSTSGTSVAPLLVVGLVAGVAGAAGTLALQGLGAPEPVPMPVPMEAAPDVPETVERAAAVERPALEPVRPRPASAPSADVDGLLARLEAAEAERAQLAATVVSLTREMGELTDAVGAVNLPRAGVGGVADTGSEAGGPSAQQGDADGPPPSPEERALASLVAAGLDPGTASALKRRQDDFALARLELVDRAAREGWEDSELFDEQLEALEQTAPDLRAELGEDGYDRYLAENGRRNRVGIEEVIPGSAADLAGLRPGDLVIGYADGRVFEPSDLQSATRAGTRGEPVNVLAERDGEVVNVSVPRGPLGITLSRERRDP